MGRSAKGMAYVKTSINGDGIKSAIDEYRKANKNLSLDRISTLLSIDSVYSKMPDDIGEFRKINTYLNPYITLKKDKITFLRIVDSRLDEKRIKEKFNKYLNVKYNHITNPGTYNQNMDKFIKQSRIVTSFLEDVLEIGNFPDEMKRVFAEPKELKQNPNLFELMKMYRGTKNKRFRFEILRKIGLVDLVSRIEKTYPLEQTDFVIREVEKLFSIGLGLKRYKKEEKFLWLDTKKGVRYSHDKEEAERQRQRNYDKMKKKYLSEIQRMTHTRYSTRFNMMIEDIQIRNKLRKKKSPYYTSFLEKMIRKNIEFPNQVHDTIGVRIVVKEHDDIPRYISMLEKFIGGSSSRKKEKDTIHKFGKEKLNPYSSKDYFVWKAVYDIALPNFAIKHLEEIRRNAKDKQLQNIISKKIREMKKNPVNNIVEVQVQDLESYLLSMAKESTTEHARLKMNEIRQNSFFKLFPVEVYKREIEKVKQKIIRNG